jgi:hypothetical protein
MGNKDEAESDDRRAGDEEERAPADWGPNAVAQDADQRLSNEAKGRIEHENQANDRGILGETRDREGEQ